MSDTVSFSGAATGTAIFDFDAKEVYFRRTPDNLQRTSIRIPFDDITGVEISPPKLGGLMVPYFSLIVKGKRLINDSKQEMTTSNVKRGDYQQLCKVLERLVQECGLSGVRDYGQSYAPKTNVAEYISHEALAKSGEHRMRCNVCGAIFCYTDQDALKNLDHKLMANMHGIGAATNAFAGTRLDVYGQANAQDRELNKIVDYSRCPTCHSTDISEIKDNQAGAAAQSSTPHFSAADELKKYKELLDLGVLTQEEFDAKKKQLLGL